MHVPTSLRSIALAVAALAPFAAHAYDRAAVQHEIDEMNQSLPAMVSPVLREEPIRFAGGSLIYSFTRVGPASGDTARDLNVTARGYLLQQLCSDTDTRQMMREGLTFSFTYNDAAVDAARPSRPGTQVVEKDCAGIASR